MTTGPDAKKVIRQVEYYFGDSNMQRDKFLQDEVAKDAEGWVPLTTMLKVAKVHLHTLNQFLVQTARGFGQRWGWGNR